MKLLAYFVLLLLLDLTDLLFQTRPEPIVVLFVVVAHLLTLILVFPPLRQSIRHVHRPSFVEDVTLGSQSLGKSLDPSSPSMLGRMVLLGLLAMALIIRMVFLVLLLRFLVRAREVEGWREADHHIPTLVKHGRTACSARDFVGEGSGLRSQRVDIAVLVAMCAEGYQHE